jgi:hypothetical protein
MKDSMIKLPAIVNSRQNNLGTAMGKTMRSNASSKVKIFKNKGERDEELRSVKRVLEAYQMDSQYNNGGLMGRNYRTSVDSHTLYSGRSLKLNSNNKINTDRAKR